MASNKHATIRYNTLDKCFRNPGRKYFINDLIEACNKAIYDFSGIDDGVKRRQILYDITFMESEQGWSISLERYRENRKVYYRYSNLNFSIQSQPLNETEAAQLKEALMTLNRFKGMPQFEWVDEMTARLDATFNFSEVSKQVIEFEQNQYLKGLNFISTIYYAIIYKKVLEITYQSFKQQKPSILTYHPYYLKQYNNRWFLFAWNDKFNAITNLALDRIIAINEVASIYQENIEIDFTEYFEDAIGVTVDAPAQKICIKIDKDLWPYIKSKPLHGSQKIKESHTDYTIIELYIIVNYELKSLLFSYGDSLTILEPDFLIQALKDKANKLLNNYF